MTCRDCIHYLVCLILNGRISYGEDDAYSCAAECAYFIGDKDEV